MPVKSGIGAALCAAMTEPTGTAAAASAAIKPTTMCFGTARAMRASIASLNIADSLRIKT
jgi:hypothetical protein